MKHNYHLQNKMRCLNNLLIKNIWETKLIIQDMGQYLLINLKTDKKTPSFLIFGLKCVYLLP